MGNHEWAQQLNQVHAMLSGYAVFIAARQSLVMLIGSRMTVSDLGFVKGNQTPKPCTHA